jgi:hypothetical protein
MSQSVGLFFYISRYNNFTPSYIGIHIILFSHLLSINHKCTHSRYLLTATQIVAQKLEKK